MGVGATDTAGRVLASLHGAGPVASQFEPCAEVPRTGVSLAVPALPACSRWLLTSRLPPWMVIAPGPPGARKAPLVRIAVWACRNWMPPPVARKVPLF